MLSNSYLFCFYAIETKMNYFKHDEDKFYYLFIYFQVFQVFQVFSISGL